MLIHYHSAKNLKEKHTTPFDYDVVAFNSYQLFIFAQLDSIKFIYENMQTAFSSGFQNVTAKILKNKINK